MVQGMVQLHLKLCVCVFKQAYKMMFPVMSDCPPSQAITRLRISAIPHLLEGR